MWATHLGELSVDAVSCEPAIPFLSSSFSCRHDASLNSDGSCQEMSPTAMVIKDIDSPLLPWPRSQHQQPTPVKL